MRGGFRQNAGRKKGFAAKNAEEARKLLSERLVEEIKPISEVLISQAKKGDIKAIRELFDRAWGRPQQEIKIPTNNLNIGFGESFEESRKKAKEAIARYLASHSAN